MIRPSFESHSGSVQKEHSRAILDKAEQDLERLSHEIGLLNEALREKLMELKAVAMTAQKCCYASEGVCLNVTGLESIAGVILMKSPYGNWVLENLPIDLFQDERLQAQSELLDPQPFFTTAGSSETPENVDSIPVFQPKTLPADSLLEQWQDYDS